MTFSREATVKMWALKSAGLLFALAVALFIAFSVLSAREEVDAIRSGDPYDSIGSSYLWLVPTATAAFVGAALAIAIYFGLACRAKLTRQINEPRLAPFLASDDYGSGFKS
jgi:hypothetical protein